MIIDKVITVLLSYENMETVANSYTYDKTDFWADYNYIIENKLEKCLSKDELNALKNKDADYVAFRLDD